MKIKHRPIIANLVSKKILPYQKPRLEELGDLRALTLGGSIGSGDTGGTSGTRLPAAMPPPGYPNPGGLQQPDGRPPLP